jgi:opacity protein-like surface antigen
MTKTSIALAAFAAALLAGTAQAADVTYERLLNPDKEPQNWLMHQRQESQAFVRGAARRQIGQ